MPSEPPIRRYGCSRSSRSEETHGLFLLADRTGWCGLLSLPAERATVAGLFPRREQPRRTGRMNLVHVSASGVVPRRGTTVAAQTQVAKLSCVWPVSPKCLIRSRTFAKRMCCRGVVSPEAKQRWRSGRDQSPEDRPHAVTSSREACGFNREFAREPRLTQPAHSCGGWRSGRDSNPQLPP